MAESIYEYYKKPSLDERARLGLLERSYDSLSMPYVQSMMPDSSQSILELGPGMCSMAKFMLDIRPQATLTVVDNSELVLERADEMGLTTLNIDLNTFEGPKHPTDFIYARGVIHVIYQRRRLLDRLVDSLALGGRLMVESFDFGPAASQAEGHLAAVWEAMCDGGQVVGVETNWLAQLVAEMDAYDQVRVVDARHCQPLAYGGGVLSEYWLHSVELARPFLRPGFVSDEQIDNACRQLLDPAQVNLYPGLTSVVVERCCE